MMTQKCLLEITSTHLSSLIPSSSHRKPTSNYTTLVILQFFVHAILSCVSMSQEQLLCLPNTPPTSIVLLIFYSSFKAQFKYLHVKTSLYHPFLFLPWVNVFTPSIGNPYLSSNHIAFMIKALEGGDQVLSTLFLLSSFLTCKKRSTHNRHSICI